MVNGRIYRILGKCLLISNLPGKALRTRVYIARLAVVYAVVSILSKLS